MLKRTFSIILSAAVLCLAAAGCADSENGSSAPTETEPAVIETNLPKPDSAKWQYDDIDDVYYQLGLSYCETPANELYEKLAVFVPAEYMNAADNGDGTYTCELNGNAEINGYNASSAPIVMPIETPGYAAAPALTAYEDLWEYVTYYTSQGFVFVFAGCRGISEGAPAGVTDLKAAVRYLRYCDDVIAGDADKIFVYGTSGGGAQAAILGASGDSALYTPYLEEIGAVKGVSDAVFGAMCWCPITDLDTADAEYEWMMGCTRSGLSEDEQNISDSLAAAFADYVNSAGFTDSNGNELKLTESEDGIYQAGSYFDYIKSEIEKSLNNYLSDTYFSDSEVQGGFKTAKEYIDAMNSEGEWIKYDESTNTASITSVRDFCLACKRATDDFIAFDSFNSSNTLFGLGDGKSAHFDSILADVLNKHNSEYAADYSADLKKTDSVGYTVEQRVNMYTPLYYLMKSREGYGTSVAARHWRIRSGIEQRNTSVTTEVNLALALQSYDGVESVDFETVWAQEHIQAERSGDSGENFIKWVNSCMEL